MDIFYIDDIYDYNYTYEFDFYYYENDTVIEVFDFYKMKNTLPIISYVIAWIVIWIGFPLTLLAICALYSLVQNEHVAPVYVINLLISDLVQMCCLVIWVGVPRKYGVFYHSKLIYFIGVMASVGFMVCVSLERYLVIACPLWYRFRRTIKFSVLISITVWALCLIEFCIALLTYNPWHLLIFRSILLLLPFPILIFSLVGTLKALSGAIAVSLKEKRRIVGTLVLVLLNYTVLFLPYVIWLLKSYKQSSTSPSDSGLYLYFLQFSPLADLVLYVFMRKGAVDKLMARLCCCKMTKQEDQGQVATGSEKSTDEVCSV